MGRIFETRKATMFARWNKMAKAFTRVARELTMAAKAGGPSPDTNAMLRRAIQNARALNMPKDKIESAIKLASGKDTSNYEELVYEGYASHGIAVAGSHCAPAACAYRRAASSAHTALRSTSGRSSAGAPASTSAPRAARPHRADARASGAAIVPARSAPTRRSADERWMVNPAAVREHA